MDSQGVWDGHIYIAVFKMVAWMGEEFGREWVHVYDG